MLSENKVIPELILRAYYNTQLLLPPALPLYFIWGNGAVSSTLADESVMSDNQKVPECNKSVTTSDFPRLELQG